MDLAEKRHLLARLIADRAVQPVFQPIVDLTTGHVVGVEALTRGPAGSPLAYPDALFGAAVETDLLFELDTLCVAQAIRAATAFEGDIPPLLFVNADPRAFTRRPPQVLPDAVDVQRAYRVIVEFTEHALATNPTGLVEVAAISTGLGDGLALDDVGADRCRWPCCHCSNRPWPSSTCTCCGTRAGRRPWPPRPVSTSTGSRCGTPAGAACCWPWTSKRPAHRAGWPRWAGSPTGSASPA